MVLEAIFREDTLARLSGRSGPEKGLWPVDLVGATYNNMKHSMAAHLRFIETLTSFCCQSEAIQQRPQKHCVAKRSFHDSCENPASTEQF